jgi:hypothetical protein
MRDVVLVSEQELKRMRAMLERDLSLALPSAEMKMIEVVWDRLIERRQFGVNKQVMMTGILAIGASGRETHVFQAKIYGELRWQDRAFFDRIGEINLGAWR